MLLKLCRDGLLYALVLYLFAGMQGILTSAIGLSACVGCWSAPGCW